MIAQPARPVSFNERWIDDVYSEAVELKEPLHITARRNLDLLEAHVKRWEADAKQPFLLREDSDANFTV